MKKFSRNIKYDEDAYYMSCPEFIADYIANLLKGYKCAVELCSAIGITACALAKNIEKVYAVEIDSQRIEMAKYNATLYGVNSKIDFIQGDVLNTDLLKSIQAEVAILDPDWSVDENTPEIHSSSLENTTPNAIELVKKVRKYITNNIVIRVSKNVSAEELKNLGSCHIHNIIYGNKLRFKYAFYLENIKESKEINDDFGEIDYK